MTYFPLLIKYTETDELEIVQSPDEIVSGKSFTVIETRYVPNWDTAT